MTFEEASKLFKYDPQTGKITRLKNGRCATSEHHGILSVRYGRKEIAAHRLAYLLHYGHLPDNMAITHANGNKFDNRIKNLVAMPKCVITHKKVSMRSLLRQLPRGVDKKNNRKWAARITVNGKQIHLGSFSSARLAQKAYQEAAAAYYGKFAFNATKE